MAKHVVLMDRNLFVFRMKMMTRLTGAVLICDSYGLNQLQNGRALLQLNCHRQPNGMLPNRRRRNSDATIAGKRSLCLMPVISKLRWVFIVYTGDLDQVISGHAAQGFLVTWFILLDEIGEMAPRDAGKYCVSNDGTSVRLAFLQVHLDIAGDLRDAENDWCCVFREYLLLSSGQ